MKPRWQKIEKEHPWLQTKMFDYDKDKEMVEKHKISENLPTFVFLDRENKEFLRLHGELSKEKLIEIILENKNK